MVFYPVYAVFFAEHGLSGGEISSLLAAWSLTALVLEVPSGALADRLPRRILLVVATLLRSAGFALWVLAPGYPAFLVGFLLWSVKSALTSGTVESLIYEALVAERAESRYPRLLGRAAAIALLANLGATLLAAPALRFGGYALVAWLSVLAGLAQAGVVLWMPEAPRAAEGRRSAGTRAPALLVGAFAGYARTLRVGVVEAFGRPGVRLLVLLVGAGGLLGIDEYLPLVARSIGVPDPLIPTLLVVPLLAQVTGSWLAGRLAGRLSSVGAVIVVLAVAAGVAGALSRSVVGFVLIGLAFGGFAAVSRAVDARLQQQVVGAARATVTSVAGLAGELGALTTLGAWALGSGHLDEPTLFAVLFVLPLVIALGLRGLRTSGR